MLEVQSTAQCGHAALGSGKNGNKSVAGATSEAFARGAAIGLVPLQRHRLSQLKYPTIAEWAAVGCRLAVLVWCALPNFISRRFHRHPGNVL